MMKLHTIKPARGSKKTSKRLGRGAGSGRGKTAGRGTKGQKSRSGGKSGLKLKGLKRTLQRIPKLRGFKSPHAKMEAVSLKAIEKVFPKNGIITPNVLAKHGLVSGPKAKVKLLGTHEIKSKWTIKGCKVTAGARAAIEKAGGSVV